MGLACKNNPKSYGRSSISYITQWGQTNRPLVSWNYLDGNLGVFTEIFCCTTYYGQTHILLYRLRLENDLNKF
mgnify:CR=1 FL=1